MNRQNNKNDKVQTVYFQICKSKLNHSVILEQPNSDNRGNCEEFHDKTDHSQYKMADYKVDRHTP